MSTTDPDATPMRLSEGETKLGYQAHYVVDGGKARVILNVLVTPSEVSENRDPCSPCCGAVASAGAYGLIT